MNKGLIFICLALLVFVGIRERETILRWKGDVATKPQKSITIREEKTEDSDTSSNTPPPVPESVKEQVSSQTSPSAGKKADDLPSPAPPQLAPGIYVLRERYSVPTDAGIRAYNAGTQVTKTGEELGLFVVTDGKNSFSVPESKLTRDMAEVANLQRAKLDGGAGRTGATSPGLSGEVVERRRAEIKANLADTDRQLNNLRTTIYNIHVKQGTGRATKEEVKAAAPRGDYERQIQALEIQRTSLQAKLSALSQ